ncbi:MAG: hypothetical protein FRX49_08302 [Trebouxia sp. A1-2]|nr:MAG: hypothetical protein FRX49_08302 [Trebouxia sp. A1-2]
MSGYPPQGYPQQQYPAQGVPQQGYVQQQQYPPQQNYGPQPMYQQGVAPARQNNDATCLTAWFFSRLAGGGMTSQEYMAMGHKCPAFFDFAIMITVQTVNTDRDGQGALTAVEQASPGSYWCGSQSPDSGSGLSLPPLGAIHTSFPPLLNSFTMAPSVRLFVACGGHECGASSADLRTVVWLSITLQL